MFNFIRRIIGKRTKVYNAFTCSLTQEELEALAELWEIAAAKKVIRGSGIAGYFSWLLAGKPQSYKRRRRSNGI